METKNKKKVNIAEILQNAPKDIEINLYSTLIGYCKVKEVLEEVVKVIDSNGFIFQFLADGKYYNSGECLLFPSPAKTWENWQDSLFCEGCFVSGYDCTFLYRGDHVCESCYGKLLTFDGFDEFRFATMEEIKKFLDNLLKNDLKYNAKTKRIEPRIKQEEDDIEINTIRFTVSKDVVSEYKLTKKQFDSLRPIIELITKK